MAVPRRDGWQDHPGMTATGAPLVCPEHAAGGRILLAADGSQVLVVRAHPRAWPPTRVVVGLHADDEDRLAASRVAALLGAEPPAPRRRRESLPDEELTARTLT